MQGSGRKHHGRHFLLVVATPADVDDPGGRVGVTVTKRVGNAVTRNRIKRWVRELVRSDRDAWTRRGRDIVVIAKASAASATHAEVDEDLRSLGGRL